MKLSTLADAVALGLPGPDRDVTGLTADSRDVRPGMLFAALPGTRVDGDRFIAAAVEAGAVAILSGRDHPDLAVPVLAVADVRAGFARIAARFYGRQPATIVAITGTSGKTSVAGFLRQLWHDDGTKAASIGTLGVISETFCDYGSLTTPDTVSLHRLLAQLADSGVTHLAMEASSHGLDQRRLDGVEITAAAFTNLGRDHLDYHPDEEAYFQAKLGLFDRLLAANGTAVLDLDQPRGAAVAAVCRQRGIRILSIGRGGADLRLVSVEATDSGQTLCVEADGRTHTVVLPLIGGFQVDNALVAAGLAVATGTTPGRALMGLAALRGAPGRLELVGRHKSGARAFIDYAHKPEALETVLRTLRPHTANRLIVIFGAGGDRDRGKRPLMGTVAARGADVVIVTDDNPRSEEPAAIRRAILETATGAREIGDRGEAIRTGVAMLEAGDVLVVAGKGHEEGQIVGDRVLPFSDRDVLERELEL